MQRNIIFDQNRGINYEMEQEVQRLQQLVQQMQDQHRIEMELLRQQLVQPERAFQLTADQLLTKFQRIKVFSGKGDDSLQEFISSVENVAILCGENEAVLQYGLRLVCKEKIQGEAKLAVQRLGDNLTWETVKSELKLHFRPRKTYKKLMDECRNLKVSSLRELFNIVRSINYQLNELYEFDDFKPPNYNPDSNDRNLVDIVKDMLNGCYRTNIQNGMTLIEVVNLFDNLGLLDESDVIHHNFRKNRDNRPPNNRDRNFNKHNNNSRQNSGYSRQDNNFKNTSYNNRSPGQNFGQNSGQYSGQQRSFHNNNGFNNNNSGQFRYRNNNSNSGQFRRNYGDNQRQFREATRNNDNTTEPMEIDNIQRQDVNFLDEPRTENSQ